MRTSHANRRQHTADASSPFLSSIATAGSPQLHSASVNSFDSTDPQQAANDGQQQQLPPYFVKNWNHILVNVASMLLFTVILVVIFVCYQLAEPYFYGFMTAILVSITFHPTKSDKKDRERCIAQMRRINKERSNNWHGRWLRGPVVSLVPYVKYLLVLLARFFGLNKLRYLGKLPLATTALIALFAIQLSNALIVLAAVSFVGAWMLLTVVLLPFNWFVKYTTRIIKVAFFVFILVFFCYSMAVDAIVVSEKVQSQATASQDKFGDAARFIREKVVTTVLEEINTAFHRNNVTATAIEIKETFGPLVGNLTLTKNTTYWQEKATGFWEALSDFAGDGEHLGTGVQQVVGSFSNKFMTVVEFLWKMVLSPFMSLILAITEFIVFFYTLTFLRGLPNTVLYSVLWKAQSVLHPFTAAQRARLMEEDIIRQFWTLCQSFWHICIFHFGLSFSVLKWVGFPLPGIVAFIGVAAVIFPVGPKFLTSCFVALVVNILSQPSWIANVDPEGEALVENISLAVAWYLQYSSEEWLIKVEGQHSHPPFVIGMTMICGLMAFGMKGVVLGPLIVILVITCYDAWGWDDGANKQEGDTENKRAGSKKRAASVKPGTTNAQSAAKKRTPPTSPAPKPVNNSFSGERRSAFSPSDVPQATPSPFSFRRSAASPPAHPVEMANLMLNLELATSRGEFSPPTGNVPKRGASHEILSTSTVRARSESPEKFGRAHTTMFSIDDAPPPASASINHVPFSPDPLPAVTSKLRRRK